MNLQQIMRVVLCAALVALVVAGAGFFSTQPVAGREAKPAALQGAAALEQLKQDGQYESLQAALKQARFNSESAGRETANALTIDPLFSQQQKLLAADGGGGDYFGTAVALSGNTAVVGAHGDGPSVYSGNGSVYVFTRSGSTWTFQQKLVANDGEGGDWFGWSVAIDGDTIVVGAPENTAPPVKQGWAYVFTRSGSTWTQQPKLFANDGLSGDHFGLSVAIDGNTVVVGAPQDDVDGKIDQGSAYVFTRSGSTWTFQKKLTANDGEANDWFGHAVAVSGDTAVVGAYQDNIDGKIDQGSAYVFTRSGSTWTQQPKITANDGVAGDFFGFAVALDGDTVVVGAVRVNAYRGAAYVFTGSGSTWTLQQKLADDSVVSDHFGWSVSLSGDTIAVGAYRDNVGANPGQGSAYVFTRSGSLWTQQPILTANDGAANDFFGWSVAVSGRTVVVGAGADDITTATDQGSAYVFVGPCPALTFAPADLPSRASGIWYQQQLTVSGGLGPYQFALGSGALPPGISLTSGGLLSGMPTTPGTYYLTINVDDPNNACSASYAYTLTIVSCLGTSITIMPDELPGGYSGEPYSQTLTATGSTGPYSFSAKPITLPSGLSLSQDGVLSGTPTTWGLFEFRVYVTDANGCTGSQICTLAVGLGGGGGGGESSLAPRKRRQQ